MKTSARFNRMSGSTRRLINLLTNADPARRRKSAKRLLNRRDRHNVS